MRRYELMLLLRPDLEDDKLQAAVERVTRAIVNGGGSLSKVSPWGKRRLAYEIGPHREASYFLIHFDIEPGQVREIERGMLISEEILRHLVTVLEDRGAADEELAPAAAPRADAPAAAESGERASTEEPTSADSGDSDDSDDGEADADDDTSNDDDADSEDEDTSNDDDDTSNDDEAEEAPAPEEEPEPEEERAAG